MQQTLTRIDISKEYLNFSAGHFTLFSATERENLHGHNFQVRCAVTAAVGDDGLAFDYALLKRVLKALCDQLDERVLLPQWSPYLRIERQDGLVFACFADERIPFLDRDVLLLPIRNVTIEELAPLLLTRLREQAELTAQTIRTIELGVSSGRGQWAFSQWESHP
ncbi:6-carboxytetrahydropterin synthase [Thiobaca trueperi]|uniref:6-carboxy-5,6,7,8-tetrahydropterin synthase n=1 Tax=Thiobaca trueperi TaxID=127458 RepID=A0A4R3MW10_9GAMM|nr:6-carboxytetrahydropterin synthase [Thiobaca trueperi]TCT20740.1 6-pyruvoyltetrahydropterin/6-carboxytetrahydropterin synthase [Thiobaca trueperi]